MHPNSPSYVDKPIERIYVQHENERENEREKIVQWTRSRQVEKASFTPIVMSMSGGEGKEAAHHHKRIATLIAQKRNESYADVINYLRPNAPSVQSAWGTWKVENGCPNLDSIFQFNWTVKIKSNRI